MPSRDTRIVHDGYFRFEIVDTVDGPREVLRVGESACALFLDRASRRIILVRQPRPSMSAEDNPDGQITELVAGIMDDSGDARTLIAKEASEEAGITISPDRIELLNHGVPLAVAPGALDECSYLGFAEITPDELEPGEHIRSAPDENERITRVYVSLDDLPDFICEDLRVLTLLLYLRLKIASEDVGQS